MVWQRVISALLAAPLVLLAGYFGGLVFALLLLALAALAWLELQHLVGQTLPLLNYGGLILLLLTIGTGWVDSSYALPAMVFGLFGLLTLQLVDYHEANWPAAALAISSYFYLGLPLVHLLLLRTSNQDWRWLLLVLLPTWAYDTFAFFAGRQFGRVRPWVRISPKKSLEGMLGGLLGSTSLTLLLLRWLAPWLSGMELILSTLGLGVGIGLLAHCGDLAESAIKRAHQVKDSGRFLPGHGGILDRMDSVLFVAPLVYYFVEYLLSWAG